MGTNVMAVLENAQTRLSATQQRADEVEAHARRILDLLANETTAWREAVDQEREFAGEISVRLGKRWSALEARIGLLVARATQEWSTLGDGLATHWDTVHERWTDCVTNLQQINLAVGEHQQQCEASRADHRGFASSHATSLEAAGENARSRVTIGGQAIGEAFAEKSAESQTGIDASLTQHSQHVGSIANEIRSRKEEATSQIDQLRIDFETDMDEKYGTFENTTKELIAELKQAAESTNDSMEHASEAIGNMASTLLGGADDVVNVLNLTNVGLSSVVGIVQKAIDICEEVIDCWEN